MLNKLSISSRRETTCDEISDFCEKCHPLSLIICVDLCQLWKIKQECKHWEAPDKPEFFDLLNTARNNYRRKILEILSENPCSLKEVETKLQTSDHRPALGVIRNHHIKLLVEAGFIRKDESIYEITPQGKKMHNIVTKSEIANLPLNFSVTDEKILVALSSGPKSLNDLTKMISKRSIHPSIRRLLCHKLIEKPRKSGRVVYFKTKRRPTRKLSPTEMKIFKALPKDGMSAKNLSEKLEVNIRSIYRYLRRLRYKRHVKKEEKTIFYSITDTGKSLQQSLNIARTLILD